MNLTNTIDVMTRTSRELLRAQLHAALAVDSVMRGHWETAGHDASAARKIDSHSWEPLYKEIVERDPSEDYVLEIYAEGVGVASAAMDGASHAADAIWFLRQREYRKAVEAAELAVSASPAWGEFAKVLEVAAVV